MGAFGGHSSRSARCTACDAPHQRARLVHAAASPGARGAPPADLALGLAQVVVRPLSAAPAPPPLRALCRYREGVHMKRYQQLRHSEEGLASISLGGDELCITLGRALMLDDTHQARGGQGWGECVSVWRQVGAVAGQSTVRSLNPALACAHVVKARLPGRRGQPPAVPNAALGSSQSGLLGVGAGRTDCCSCLLLLPLLGTPSEPPSKDACLPASLPGAQVVGRLSGGRELLPLLNSLRTDINDAPQHRVRVARCGFTNAGALPAPLPAGCCMAAARCREVKAGTGCGAALPQLEHMRNICICLCPSCSGHTGGL